MGRARNQYGEKKGVFSVLVGKPEEKRPYGRPRHRWKDNIKMDFRKWAGRGMDCTDLAQDSIGGEHL
jgi:hypothetical protein